MRATWPALRFAVVALSAAVGALLASAIPSGTAEAVGTPLTSEEVQQIAARCVAYARRAPGRPNLAIAVVDPEGNALGVYRMAGLENSQAGVDDAVATALAKAGTAAYFSSEDQTFTTRTAAFIIQDHFPPGVRFMPGGPLYGVEFSSIATSDVNRIYYPPLPAARGLGEIQTRVRGDLGAVALYRNGKRVGALGIDDGSLGRRISIPPHVFPGDDCRDDYRLTFRNMEKGRVLEQIVFAAARGKLAPPGIRSNTILVGGIRLPFTLGTPFKPVKPATLVDGVDGTWDPDYPARDGAGIASRFTPSTIDPPSGEGAGAESYDGKVPNAFPIIASTDGKLTAADVQRILWQGARQASITRAAIRRPIGLPMQCWISVVDTNGNVLGVFAFQEDATLFSFDVSVQKARTAMFFSDDKAAISCRALGLISQGFYPAGQQGAGRGPLFQFQDGLTVGLLGGVLPSPELAKIRNGITIFPGGVPLYRDGELIGGVGVSGDGVDQDDIVADLASRGFGAPKGIRSDALSGEQIKAALGRALERVELNAPADPFACDTVPNKVLSFFHARLRDAQVTLKRTDLEVESPFVKHPRHPGPVTIER
jgi:uncharacterized protein GlcG (DUF336 family)